MEINQIEGRNWKPSTNEHDKEMAEMMPQINTKITEAKFLQFFQRMCAMRGTSASETSQKAGPSRLMVDLAMLICSEY